MADPTIQSFCCWTPVQPARPQKLMSTETLMSEFNTETYILVCIVSSLIGMIGATYQILIRFVLTVDNNRLFYLENMRRFRVSPRVYAQKIGKKIIVWLAVADFLASGGVFIRSILWGYFRPSSSHTMNDLPSVLFCALVSGWTQYFYTCTWLWTISYAINIRKYLKNEYYPESHYHTFVWPMAAALTALGLTVLYYPDADCHNFQELWTALVRVLPNYFATYLPILVVMVVNPFIYFRATRIIDSDLTTRNSQFTCLERSIMKTFKWKFFMINLVFYICWLPNLICGVVLWTSWHNLPDRFMIVIWYTMAIFNPLQAFLNTLVYRKWRPSSPATDGSQWRLRLDSHSERAPLLQLPPQAKYRATTT